MIIQSIHSCLIHELDVAISFKVHLAALQKHLQGEGAKVEQFNLRGEGGGGG